jgi:YD repeat-containing protein
VDERAGTLWIHGQQRLSAYTLSGTKLLTVPLPRASTAPQAQLSGPVAVAYAHDGSLYIADFYNNRIRQVGADGIITTVAGTGVWGYSGDGGPATQARLGSSAAVAHAPDGSLYIADTDNARIRRVGVDGIITTVAGTGRGASLSTGDGGPATQANFSSPIAVVSAPADSLYIVESSGRRIRRIRPALPRTSARDVVLAAADGSLLYHFDTAGRHVRAIDTVTGTDVSTFGYDPAGRLMTVTDVDGDITHIERNAVGHPTAIVSPDGQRTTLTVNADGYLAAVTNPAGETYSMDYTPDGLLTAFTTPRGHVNQFTYDALGRLSRDTNAGGGGWTLAHTANTRGYTNRLTSAEGRTTTFTVEPLPTDDRRQVNTYPDGTVQTTLFTTSGEEVTTAPDGTVTTQRDGPDPRFGMQAPVPRTVTVKMPSGLTSSTTTVRMATLADPTNLLSLTDLTETTTINGKAYQSTYEAATATWTHISPSGRQRTTVLDSQGRPVSTQVAGLEPLFYSYDARGRLSATTVGEDADTRTTTIRYFESGPAQGYVESITDALNRRVQFEYDLGGRVTTQTLPDGRTVRYSYDANGNLTTLAPPGQPAHQFAYTPLDQEEVYTPPDLGDENPATHYVYNLDQQLTRITRPDGQTVDLTYTAGGQLETMRTTHGDYHYAYHPTTGRRSTVTAPDGGTLS